MRDDGKNKIKIVGIVNILMGLLASFLIVYSASQEWLGTVGTVIGIGVSIVLATLGFYMFYNPEKMANKQKV